MKTRIYKADDLAYDHVREDIRTTILAGRNVVFPTETVYGIGANAIDETGIRRIYDVKGRPSDNPLILHIADADDVTKYVTTIRPYAKRMMERFWPGPLTLVFDKSEIVPDAITGGLDTVGIRLPDSAIARDIIRIAGVPICAPSANISGRPSATLLEHVIDDFSGKVDIIIDGGKTPVGIESTVVDVTGDHPVILRPGMISRAMLAEIDNLVSVNEQSGLEKAPKSPGMKYKHYAPKGELVIIDGAVESVVSTILERLKQHETQGDHCAVITTSEYQNKFPDDVVFVIGDADDDETIAANLFAILREADRRGMTHIYSMAFASGPHAEAIMNRLLKAADGRIITV